MKTYAICTTPQELQAKLVNYYRHQEAVQRSLVRSNTLKRDCDRHEAHAGMYAKLAGELEALEILAEPQETIHNPGMYL